MNMKKLLLFLVIAVSGLTAFAAKNVTELNDKDAATVVTEAKRPFVVDFSATWCGPCKMFKPTFEAVAAEMDGKVDFYSVDVDRCPQFSAAMRIQAVPTIFIFNPVNQKSKVFNGVVSKDEFVTAIKAVMSDK